MEELVDVSQRYGLHGFLIALLIVFVRTVWGFAKNVKTRVVAKWDEHYQKTEDHEIKLAVHSEKHRSHEKRLDHLEDDRTGSGEK